MYSKKSNTLNYSLTSLVFPRPTLLSSPPNACDVIQVRTTVINSHLLTPRPGTVHFFFFFLVVTYRTASIRTIADIMDKCRCQNVIVVCLSRSLIRCCFRYKFSSHMLSFTGVYLSTSVCLVLASPPTLSHKSSWAVQHSSFFSQCNAFSLLPHTDLHTTPFPNLYTCPSVPS